MRDIPILKEKIFSAAKSEAVGRYVWDALAVPQLGYSFSEIHSKSYSYIGLQSAYLATYFNPIYWNTACLIVNSGSLEDNSTEEVVDIYEPEGADLAEGVTFIDFPDKAEKIRRTSSTDYSKIAKAIGSIKSKGVSVDPVDINQSDFGFAPDVKNNRILFGLKALLNVGDEVIGATLTNRPYVSPVDYLERVKPNKSAMISLIKAGAFDSFINREDCMKWYIWETCDKKSRLTLQNMPSLIKYNLVPTSGMIGTAKRVYEFNRYLKAITKADKTKYEDTYSLDERAINFLNEMGLEDIMITDNLGWFVRIKKWEKIYQNYMDILRDWLSKEKTTILEKLNQTIFQEDWNKYAKGNISAWEMEVMCFYYHDHELKNANKAKYGLVDYFSLPEESIVDKSFKKGDKEIKIFKLSRICGTCIAKDKIKNTISLLTTEGVVDVSLRKEYFALLDRQISTKLPTGEKKVLEKSWLSRGTMLMVQGMRSGDRFIAKKYSTGGAAHQVYKIQEIDAQGNLTLIGERRSEE